MRQNLRATILKDDILILTVSHLEFLGNAASIEQLRSEPFHLVLDRFCESI